MRHESLWQSYDSLIGPGFDPQDARVVDFMDGHRGQLESYQNPEAEVAVVIPAFNEMCRLPRTLAAIDLLLEDRPREIRVVVVDNASTDATGEVAKYFGVEVVQEPTQGIACARQAGLETTNEHNRVILTTDADTVVPANWVEAHLQSLADDTVVFSGGHVRFLIDQRLLPIARKRFDTYFAVRQLFQLVKYHIVERTQPQGGANSGFRRDQAINIGYQTQMNAGEDRQIMLDLIRVCGGCAATAQAEVLTSARRMVDQGVTRRLVLGLMFNLKLLVGADFNGESPEVYENIRPEEM